jgi:ParB family chromosome partitioning protein
MSGLELKGFSLLKGLDDLVTGNNLSKDKVTFMQIDRLTPGKYQPRTEFQDESLNELAASIKANGIIQPIIARAIENDIYEIIAGERRWRASKLAGLDEVPVIIRELSDKAALAIALIENVQREDLNPIDQAVSLLRLGEEFSMTHQVIAETVGISRSTVTNFIRLLALAGEVQYLLKTRLIEIGHAKTLFSLTQEQQVILAHRIVENKYSVRQTEKIARSFKETKSTQTLVPLDSQERIAELRNAIARKLPMTVNITMNKNQKGKIEISFNNIREAEKFAKGLQFFFPEEP